MYFRPVNICVSIIHSKENSPVKLSGKCPE
jgi:hypothetical protein